MTDKLTLIEDKVLDELLEKAFAFDQLQNPICGYVINQIDWKQVEIDKANFLTKYVTVPIDLDETIMDGLEKLGYE